VCGFGSVDIEHVACMRLQRSFGNERVPVGRLGVECHRVRASADITELEHARAWRVAFVVIRVELDAREGAAPS